VKKINKYSSSHSTKKEVNRDRVHMMPSSASGCTLHFEEEWPDVSFRGCGE
jgi:hypothetical protein